MILKVKKIIDNIKTVLPEVSIENLKSPGSRFLKVALISLFELMLVISFLPIIFETDDDALMNSILSGAMSGASSEYVLFINVLLARAIKLFYLCFPVVNWYTWHMLFAFFMGYVALQYSFSKIKGTGQSKIVRHLFVFSLLFFSLVMLQFTRISAVTLLGGFSLIALSRKMTVGELILSALMIFWGALIRYNVYQMLVLLSVPLIVFLLMRKRFLVIGVLITVGVFAWGGQNYHTNKYHELEQFKSYRQFSSLAAGLYIHNNPEFRFNNQQQVAKTLGWSNADLVIASQSNLDVGHPKFSKNNLRKLYVAARTVSDKFDEGYFGTAIQKTIRFFMGYLNQTYMFPFYILLILLLIHFNNRQRIFFLLFVLYVFSIAFALFFIRNGIPKHRVLFGLLSPLFLWSLAQFNYDNIGGDLFVVTRFMTVSLLKKCVLVLAVLSVLLPIAAYGRKKDVLNNQNQQALRVHNKILEENDPFCAIWTDVRSYNVFQNPYSMKNMYRLGWIAGSPWNKQKIERYIGEDNSGIYNIFNKDIVWYFNPYYYHKFANSIENFYLTNYKNCNFVRDTLYTDQADSIYQFTIFIPSDKIN